MKPKSFSIFIILFLILAIVVVGSRVFKYPFTTLVQSTPSPKSQLAQVSSSQSCSVVCSGLTGYWPLDDGSGATATDASGNGHTGTLVNSPTWTAGTVGSGALQLDGSSQYMSIPSLVHSAFPITAFSVSVWVNRGGSGGSLTAASIFSALNNGTGLSFCLTHSEGVVFSMKTAVSTYSAYSGSCPSTGAWHLYTGTWDGTTATLYIDGASVMSTTTAGTSLYDGGLATQFGRNVNTGNSYLNGTVDDIRLYNRALSSGEVQQLYALGGNNATAPANSQPSQSQPSQATSTPDTTPPVISNIAVSNITSTGAYVSWTTNENSTSQVVYGLTSSYGSQTALNNTLTTSHSVQLSGLMPNTVYHYEVQSLDASNNTAASSDQTFTTQQASQTSPTSPTPTSTLTVTPTQVQTPVVPYSGSAITIGSESLINFPTSALWSPTLNFTPGNGETVPLNPPRFTWSYVPDPSNDDCYPSYCANWAPHDFVFQVAADPTDLANQTNLLVNVTTPYNFYNTVGPLPTNTASTFYWRVGYLSPTNPNYTSWQLGISNNIWSNSVTWSSTKSFTIAPGATTWDRSMLADNPLATTTPLSAYLTAQAAHPHLLFNASDRAALANWLQTNQPSTWASLLAQANTAESSSWWNETSPASSGGGSDWSWQSNIATVAFVCQMTQSASCWNGNGQTTVAQALTNAANYFVTSGEYRTDPEALSGFDISKDLALAYDWTYPVMTATQRSQVLNAFSLNAKYFVDLFYGSAASSGHFCDFSASNTCPYYVLPTSNFKSAVAHGQSDFYSLATVALAAYGDNDANGYPDPAIRWMFDAEMNYMIGKEQSLGGDQGLNEGRAYDYTGFLADDWDANYLYSNILASIAFPQADFSKNTYWASIADWLGRDMPVGFEEQDEPWGDSGGGTYNYWSFPSFRDLAYLSGSGNAYQQYLNQLALIQQGGMYNTTKPDFTEVPLTYYAQNNLDGLTIPSPTVNNALSKVDPVGGWTFGCSAPVNTSQCFESGTGFIFQSRPEGGFGPSGFSDLSYQLWAYGVPITDSGDCYGNFTCGLTQYEASEYNTIMVNGIGQSQHSSEPTAPYYSRVFAYETNPANGSTPAYTYVAADGTNAYPIVAYGPDGLAGAQSTGPLGPSGAGLQKVRRHILFVRNKYYVVYDDMSSRNPATYSMLYDVPYLYHVVANGESDVSNTQVDTMQMSVASTTSFSYTTGSVTPHDISRDSTIETDVTTEVVNVNDPSTVSVNDEHGLPSGNLSVPSVLTNPITALQPVELDNSYDVQGAQALPRAHTIWISNKTPSGSFHFLTVIYPIPPNETASNIQITRIDDYTVKVADTAAGTSDIISFNPATAAANGATILVDLSQLTPESVTDDVTGQVLVSSPYIAPQVSIVSSNSGPSTPAASVANNSASAPSSPSASPASTASAATNPTSPTLTTPVVTASSPVAIISSTLLSIPLGTRSSSVIALQDDLINYGYLAKGLNTGYYGTLTQAAVAKYRSATASATAAQSIPVTTTEVSSLFTRTLTLGSTGTDVKNLQIFLNGYGFTVAQSGNGSKGHETTYFGPATKAALIRFQDVYAAEILKPEGLTQGTGFFGTATEKEVNGILAE